MEKIATFTTDEHRFLSNFYPYKKDGSKYPYPVEVIYNGIIFDCVENAYQAAKSLDKELQLQFSCMHPKDTKAYWEGHTDIREDWNNIKFEIMKELVTQKFINNQSLAKMLIDTGDAILEEGNDWGDVYWGIDNGIGENNLGKILMNLRNCLRQYSL